MFGRFASIIVIIGLLSLHWLAIYDFSRHSTNLVINAVLVNIPLRLTLTQVSTAIAIFLLIAAIIVNQIAVRTLGKFFDRLTIKAEHQLITTGIYGLVRHPI